jgi:7,8-dihydro-6-hydroxymethylpterin-pyrophosphokinase
VVRLRTVCDPQELLAALKRAELRLGRQPTFRYGPRIIDLDVLLFDDLSVNTPELEIPHPRMMERAFVLRPLAELDPQMRHPRTGERIADRIARGGLERTAPIFPGADLLPEETRDS